MSGFLFGQVVAVSTLVACVEIEENRAHLADEVLNISFAESLLSTRSVLLPSGPTNARRRLC